MPIDFFSQNLGCHSTGSFKYSFEPNLYNQFKANDNNHVIINFQFEKDPTFKPSILNYYFTVLDPDRFEKTVDEYTEFEYGKVGELEPVKLTQPWNVAIKAFKDYLGEQIHPGISLGDPVNGVYGDRAFTDVQFHAQFIQIDTATDNSAPENPELPTTDVIITYGYIHQEIIPVTGNFALTSITNDQWDGYITWTGDPLVINNTVFNGPNRSYKATIRLEPKEGFTLKGMDPDIFMIVDAENNQLTNYDCVYDPIYKTVTIDFPPTV